jgi:hypothetical protein
MFSDINICFHSESLLTIFRSLAWESRKTDNHRASEIVMEPNFMRQRNLMHSSIKLTLAIGDNVIYSLSAGDKLGPPVGEPAANASSRGIAACVIDGEY